MNVFNVIMINEKKFYQRRNAWLAGAVEYTASLQKGKTSPHTQTHTQCPEHYTNNLMVWFQ